MARSKPVSKISTFVIFNYYLFVMSTSSWSKYIMKIAVIFYKNKIRYSFLSIAHVHSATNIGEAALK